MSLDHLTTYAVFGPCATAPHHSSGDPAHVVGMAIYCPAHCPKCKPPEFSAGPIQPVAGEQDEFFSPDFPTARTARQLADTFTALMKPMNTLEEPDADFQF